MRSSTVLQSVSDNTNYSCSILSVASLHSIMYRNCVAVVTSEEHIVEMSVLLSILNYYLLHYWLFLRVHLSVKVSVLQIKMVSM